MSSEELPTPIDSERRGADRRKWIVDVQFEGGDATGITHTEDISLGGLYMATDAELPTGTEIFMRLTVAGERLELAGVVAYAATGRGVGVKFHDVPEDVSQKLKEKLGLE